MPIQQKKNCVRGVFGVLMGLNLLAWLAVWQLGPAKAGLEVTFFDVGQGDAAFIEMPQRVQILIDGGPSGEKILEKLGKEMPFWDRTIDLVVLTHPEKDHLSGLLEVLERYKVENILWTGVVRDTAEYREWVKLIGEEGAKIFIAKSGEKLSFSVKLSFLNVLEILYPLENLEGKVFKDSNNTSIVARFVFGETSFLFTGDATQSVEKLLPRLAGQLDSDVLKVGHHGSKTSTSKEFVEAVSPDIAVISAGKDNSYGHPHQSVLDNLAGVRIFRTDLAGDIKIISDNLNYAVK